MENEEASITKTLHLKPNELEVISNPSLILEDNIPEIPDVIYGRLLSGKSINKIGLKRLFESLWQSKAEVKIEDYNEGHHYSCFWIRNSEE